MAAVNLTADARKQQQDKLLLRMTRDATKALSANMSRMLQWLLTYRLIDSSIYLEVMSKRSSNQRASYIHMLVMKRGPGSFENYHWCFKEVSDAYDIVKKYRMEDFCDLVKYPKKQDPDTQAEILAAHNAALDPDTRRVRRLQRIEGITAYAIPPLRNRMQTIIGILMEYDVLDGDGVDSITAAENPIEQALDLHLLIPEKGPNVYERYYIALVEGNIPHVAAWLWNLCDREYIKRFSQDREGLSFDMQDQFAQAPHIQAQQEIKLDNPGQQEVGNHDVAQPTMGSQHAQAQPSDQQQQGESSQSSESAAMETSNSDDVDAPPIQFPDVPTQRPPDASCTSETCLSMRCRRLSANTDDVDESGDNGSGDHGSDSNGSTSEKQIDDDSMAHIYT